MRQNRLLILSAIIFSAIPFIALNQKQAFNLKESIARGKEIYNMQCITCHMENGEGMEGVFPPLAKSDYLMADKTRSIRQTLHGVSGEITVNGKTYNGEMPPVELSDVEASDVLNYVRNNWGNKGDAIRPEDVKAAR